MRKLILFILTTALTLPGFGQAIDRFNPDTIKTIELDSNVKITARKFGIETFINAIVTDETFYQSFRNMKKYTFTAENRIYTYDKKTR